MILPSPYDEPSLLTQLKSGNQQAFDQLYQRFAPALSIQLDQLVHDQQLTQDLLQDTFVKVWLHLDQYNPGKGRLYTWLCRIARNVALSYLQLPRATKLTLDQLPLSGLGSVTPTYQTIGLIYWVNRTLSPYQRELIQLIYFQGYTHQEVSDELAIPLGTVKTNLYQTLLRLRQLETVATFRE